MSLIVKFFRTIYSRKYLLYTNTVTGALFLGSGDIIEQQLVESKLLNHIMEYDSKRTGSMLVAGTYFGYVGHLWYTFLDKKFPGNKNKAIAKKLLAEMAVGPPFGATIFFIVGKLEQKSVEKCWQDLKDNFLFLCLADWCFYVPLQAINFHLLPPKYRFLYVATISLIYDTFLSYILHRNDNQKESQLQK